MFPHELFLAIEPFLNAAQEALPQVPVPENATVEVEGLPPIEILVEERVVVPANTRLRDIAEVATVSFSVPPTPPENAGLVEIAECAGENSGEGASTSFPKPEWQIALDLPENQDAPECLRSHIKEQLRFLFNIGRKTTLPDPMFDSFIDPLALDEAKLGFSKALLERINALQLVHYNRGSHIPFKFSTREEKERLYSIVWEYADKLPPE